MKLKPGEFISEARFARELNISRTPVREALKKLEQEGLVISENKRKKVFILKIKDVEEIFDIKKSLEGDIVMWAIERGKRRDFNRLTEIINEMKAISSKKPNNPAEISQWAKSWLEKDKQLHDIILKMAGNKRIQQILENLNTQWHRLRVGILAMEGRIEKSTQEHDKFVQAILKKNPSEAKSAMIEHLENLEENVIKLMKIFHFPD